MNPRQFGELHDLLAKVFEGTASQDDIAQIERLTSEDIELQRYYLHMMFLYGQLHWQARHRHTHAMPQDRLTGLWGTLLGTFPHSWSQVFAGIVLAVILIGGVAVYLEFPVARHRPIPPAASIRPTDEKSEILASDNPEVVYVASLSQTTNCQWAFPDASPRQGDSLEAGKTLSLRSGLAEIDFRDGAKIFLQGPAIFRPETNNSAYLTSGKLTAKISLPKAIGFTIYTPDGVIIDRGTEFGLNVSDSGVSDVHVFKGAVDVRLLDSDKRAPVVKQLRTSQAVRLVRDRQTVELIPCDSDTFVLDTKATDDTAEQAYIAAVLADHPLLYWPLNEDAFALEFHDLSGNGFHGRALGRVIAGTPGPFPGRSQAVTLERAGFIEVRHEQPLSLPPVFSCEAWVWLGNPPYLARILSFNESKKDVPGWGLGFIPRKSSLPPPNPAIVLTRYYDSDLKAHAAAIPHECWFHLTVTHQAKQTRFFVNGELWHSTRGCPSAGDVQVSLLYLGQRRSNFEFWDGRLAHVALYPSILPDSRIREHYRLGLASKGPAPK